MNIIKVDREILAQKEFRETTTGLEAAGKKKRRSASRLSAVTMAKLQQRQQIQQLLSENSSSKDQNSNIGAVVPPQYRSPQGKKTTKRSSPNSKNMARRSLQFGSSERSTSSPRSASRLSGVRTYSKIRKSGVKNIVHTKPWK